MSVLTPDGPDMSLKRLNLGCGFDIRPGYLNVDLNDFHSPDLVADISNLTVLQNGFYDEIVAQDVLEHMTRAVAKQAFSGWARLLSPDGIMKVRVPSLLGMFRLLERGAWTVEAHEAVVHLMFGTQAYNGDFHQAGFTPPIVLDWARSAGLVVIRVADRDGWLYDLDFAKAREVNDEEFLHWAYFEMLGRPADASGLATYGSLLASGRIGRDGILAVMRESDEGKALNR